MDNYNKQLGHDVDLPVVFQTIILTWRFVSVSSSHCSCFLRDVSKSHLTYNPVMTDKLQLTGSDRGRVLHMHLMNAAFPNPPWRGRRGTGLCWNRNRKGLSATLFIQQPHVWRKSVYWDSLTSSSHQNTQRKLCKLLKWVEFSFNKLNRVVNAQHNRDVCITEILVCSWLAGVCRKTPPHTQLWSEVPMNIRQNQD